MTLKNDPTVVMIEGRLQTPHLFEVYTDKYGKTQYSAIIRLYDPKEFAKVEKAKLAACEAKWPGKGAAMLKKINGNPNCCLLRESDDEDNPYKFLRVTRRKEDGKPPTVDRRRQEVTQTDGLLVSGAYVRVIIGCWAYDNQSKGVSATILGIQYVKYGEPFGGTPMKVEQDDFEDLGDDAEAGTGEEQAPFF